ncbi:MAG: SGNH/GDSL hydrolase family protein [Lachnospiraceae bacterium]|nr:SGNH/GDSL hydrolase family protein [Lachnospiraceae bacterium]
MTKAKKRIIYIIFLFVIAAVVLSALQRLVVPKYAGEYEEGAYIGEYYSEKDKTYDVIFIGDCEVYNCYDPLKLWYEYGINSYVRGSAMQSIWQSYYLAEEMIGEYTPKVIVFNVASVRYNKPISEAYNRMTLDGMRWSKSKLGAVKASMTEGESLAGYLFPILRFHSRWSELGADDIRYYFGVPKATYHGYHPVTASVPAKDVPGGIPLADYSFGDKAWEYMERLSDLCRENDIELILVKSPSLYPEWYEEYDKNIKDYAEEKGLKYINMIEESGALKIDYAVDTGDGGVHINVYGAEKITDYMGSILKDCGVPDRRGEPVLDEIWQEESSRYESEVGGSR